MSAGSELYCHFLLVKGSYTDWGCQCIGLRTVLRSCRGHAWAPVLVPPSDVKRKGKGEGARAPARCGGVTGRRARHVDPCSMHVLSLNCICCDRDHATDCTVWVPTAAGTTCGGRRAPARQHAVKERRLYHNVAPLLPRSCCAGAHAAVCRSAAGARQAAAADADRPGDGAGRRGWGGSRTAGRRRQVRAFIIKQVVRLAWPA